MVHNIEYPQPLYTSPIGNATTVTVQTFPISETIISVSESVNKTNFLIYNFFFLIFLARKYYSASC